MTALAFPTYTKALLMRIVLGLVILLSIAMTDVTVALRVYNISVPKGCVRIAVFASEADFKAEQNAVFSRTVPLTDRSDIHLRIPLDASRPHAVAVYHDINDNGKLDRNVLGIPKEPYAFSNNPTAKWEAPSFSEISFLPGTQSENAYDLQLLAWGER